MIAYAWQAGDRWLRVQSGEPGPGNAGHYDEDSATITVRDTLDTREGVSTAIHEALHASYPFLTEDAVLSGEANVASVLFAYLETRGLTITEVTDGEATEQGG